MLEVSGDAAPIALGEVGGDHLDGLEPPRILLGAPSAQVSGAVALDHVDDLGVVEIDHARGVERGVLPRRREERGLVDAEGPDVAHPSGIVDERGAVELDGVHDGAPAHPEPASHDGDGEGQRTHLARGLGTGTHGEHGASRDVRRSLGPGLLPAAALEPDEPGRTPEAGQVCENQHGDKYHQYMWGWTPSRGGQQRSQMI